jgi:hypothetical protein
MTATPQFWRRSESGLSIRVRLTPRASQEAIGGIEETADGPALGARVRAAPTEGEANEALEKLVAKRLGVPRSTVSVAKGNKSRVKLLTVAGSPDVLERALLRTLVQAETGNQT